MIWPKICRLGSINFSQLCALESFANVHHLVSMCVVLCRICRRSAFGRLFSRRVVPVRRKLTPCSPSALMKTARGASMTVSAISVLTVWIPALLFAGRNTGSHISFHVGGNVQCRQPAGGRICRDLDKARGLWPPWALMLIWRRMRKMMKGVWSDDCRD